MHRRIKSISNALLRAFHVWKESDIDRKILGQEVSWKILSKTIMHNFFHGYQSMRRDINGSVTFVVINDPFIRKVLEYTNNESLSLAEKQIDISNNLVFIKSPRQWKNDCFHFSVKIHLVNSKSMGEWVLSKVKNHPYWWKADWDKRLRNGHVKLFPQPRERELK